MLNILIIVFILIISSIIFREEDNIYNGFLSKNHTTILKGIAIICVVINHVGMQYNIHITNVLGPIGVAIFLVLSGYGINESFKIKERKNYIKSRIKRVILPYWAIIICLSIYYLLTNVFDANIILKYVLLIAKPTDIYWYLQFIMCWYIIYYFISFVKERKTKNLLMFIMSVCFSILNKDITLYLWQILSFPMGVLISEYSIEIKNKLVDKKYILTTSVFFIMSILSLGFKAVSINRTYNQEIMAQIAMSISVSMFIVFASYKLLSFRVWKIIKWAGGISYELYLVHPFFLYMLLGSKSILVLITFIIIISILSMVLNKYSWVFKEIKTINQKKTHKTTAQ